MWVDCGVKGQQGVDFFSGGSINMDYGLLTRSNGLKFEFKKMLIFRTFSFFCAMCIQMILVRIKWIHSLKFLTNKDFLVLMQRNEE